MFKSASSVNVCSPIVRVLPGAIAFKESAKACAAASTAATSTPSSKLTLRSSPDLATAATSMFLISSSNLSKNPAFVPMTLKVSCPSKGMLGLFRYSYISAQ